MKKRHTQIPKFFEVEKPLSSLIFFDRAGSTFFKKYNRVFSLLTFSPDMLQKAFIALITTFPRQPYGFPSLLLRFSIDDVAKSFNTKNKNVRRDYVPLANPSRSLERIYKLAIPKNLHGT